MPYGILLTTIPNASGNTDPTNTTLNSALTALENAFEGVTSGDKHAKRHGPVLAISTVLRSAVSAGYDALGTTLDAFEAKFDLGNNENSKKVALCAAATVIITILRKAVLASKDPFDDASKVTVEALQAIADVIVTLLTQSIAVATGGDIVKSGIEVGNAAATAISKTLIAGAVVSNVPVHSAGAAFQAACKAAAPHLSPQLGQLLIDAGKRIAEELGVSLDIGAPQASIEEFLTKIPLMIDQNVDDSDQLMSIRAIRNLTTCLVYITFLNEFVNDRDETDPIRSSIIKLEEVIRNVNDEIRPVIDENIKKLDVAEKKIHVAKEGLKDYLVFLKAKRESGVGIGNDELIEFENGIAIVIKQLEDSEGHSGADET